MGIAILPCRASDRTSSSGATDWQRLCYIKGSAIGGQERKTESVTPPQFSLPLSPTAGGPEGLLRLFI